MQHLCYTHALRHISTLHLQQQQLKQMQPWLSAGRTLCCKSKSVRVPGPTAMNSLKEATKPARMRTCITTAPLLYATSYSNVLAASRHREQTPTTTCCLPDLKLNLNESLSHTHTHTQLIAPRQQQELWQAHQKEQQHQGQGTRRQQKRCQPLFKPNIANPTANLSTSRLPT